MNTRSFPHASAAWRRALAIALALTLVLSGSAMSVLAETSFMESGNLSKAGMFYNPYTSLEDVLADTRVKHEQIADEGTTLVKNNGLLPLTTRNVGNAPVVALFNTTDGLTDAFLASGFTVNVVSAQTTTTSGLEGGGEKNGANAGVISALTEAQLKAAKNTDAAIVRIFRTAGEGNDLSTGRSLTGNEPNDRFWGDITFVNAEGEIVEWTKEAAEAGEIFEAWPDGTPKGWNHEHLAKAEPLALYPADADLAARDETPVRHALMLTKAEEEMIQEMTQLLEMD